MQLMRFHVPLNTGVGIVGLPLLIGSVFVAAIHTSPVQQKTVSAMPTISFPSDTPIPTTQNTQSYIAPTTPVAPISTNNLETCNIDPRCGGGTKMLTKDACSADTCCQIGNNWVEYPSLSSCRQAQNDYYGVNNSSSNNQPLPTFYIAPTYAPAPTIDTSGELQQCLQGDETAYNNSVQTAEAMGSYNSSTGLWDSATAQLLNQANNDKARNDLQCHNLFGN